MRTLAGSLLVLSLVAWAVPEPTPEDLIREELHALLEKAKHEEESGRHEEAARLRDRAAELKRHLAERKEAGQEGRAKALREALHAVEHAHVTLREAGMPDMAAELARTAERLRREVEEHAPERPPAHGPDADFWRRNLDTLRIARKALLEAEKRDAADLVEQAIHARELLLSGRGDDEARKRAPNDAQLSELLRKASALWTEYGHENKAAQCLELANHLATRAPGPGPVDRIERVEERLDRIERTLHELMARLERARPPEPPHGPGGAR